MSTLTNQSVQRFLEGRMEVIWVEIGVNSNIPSSEMWNSLIKSILVRGDRLIVEFYMVAEYEYDGSFRLVETPEYSRSEVQLPNFEDVESEFAKRHVMVSKCGCVSLALFEPVDPNGV